MVTEKRKERRIKVHLPVKITYPDNPDIFGKTENISRLGSYAQTDREIPVGTDIDITLEIPIYTEDLSLSGKLRCKGNIFRCNLVREAASKKYYGIGIFFTDFLKPIDRDKLSRYIDFLVLNEDKGIKEGLARWRDKRYVAKAVKQAQQFETQQEKFQSEALRLLKKILRIIQAKI